MDLVPPVPFLLRVGQPGESELRAHVERHGAADLTYAHVGATRDALPAGWDHDEVGARIGSGAADFARAEAAFRAWEMFDLGWVRPFRRDVPLVAGEIVAFSARILGLWTINLCRIVYVVDEDDGVVRRLGFAYGTLPAHSVAGEERFLLTWDRRTDDVTFGIRKFSRLHHPLVRLGAFLTRRLQRRFNEDALARMVAVTRAPEAA